MRLGSIREEYWVINTIHVFNYSPLAPFSQIHQQSHVLCHPPQLGSDHYTFMKSDKTPISRVFMSALYCKNALIGIFLVNEGLDRAF